MIVPPRIAPTHVVILPISPKPETRDAVFGAAEKLAEQLRGVSFHGAPVEVEIDKRDIGGGTKNWEWIKKGAPVRIEIGPRDLEKGTVAVARRDQPPKEKQFLPMADAVAQMAATLQAIQDNLYARALALRDANLCDIDTREAFYEYFTPKNSAKPEIHGGFARSHWCGSPACEAQIKEDLKVTIRCIPFDAAVEDGGCVFCGNASKWRVIFAKSY
jgi:prolyl-tRNA synthetase